MNNNVHLTITGCFFCFFLTPLIWEHLLYTSRNKAQRTERTKVHIQWRLCTCGFLSKLFYTWKWEKKTKRQICRKFVQLHYDCDHTNPQKAECIRPPQDWKKKLKKTPHNLPFRDVSFYLTLSWWLVPVEIFWPWSISHPQRNLTHSHRHFWQRQPDPQGSSQLTLRSTCPTLLSGHRILWENPPPHSFTPHPPLPPLSGKCLIRGLGTSH